MDFEIKTEKAKTSLAEAPLYCVSSTKQTMKGHGEKWLCVEFVGFVGP